MTCAIRLLTFDLDNTLWPVEDVISRAELSLAQHLRERFPEHPNTFLPAALRRARDHLLHQHFEYRSNLTQLRIDSIASRLRSIGLSDAVASTEAQLAFEVFYATRNDVRLFRGAIATLERLASRFTLAALTNGNACVERTGLGHIFSFQMSAESVGKRKPDPLMFSLALERVGISPPEAIHIGDSPVEDIKAARAVGFGTVWANPLGQNWPVKEEEADSSFSSFAQLEQLADTW